MPRNASGVYTQPVTSVSPAVPSTTIISADFNTLTADVSTELTNSLDRGGRGSMTANLAMGAFKITGIGAPTVAGDVARLTDVQNAAAALNMANFKITSLGTPTVGTDAATKAYVDTASGTAAIRSVTTQQFASSGTYTPNANMIFCLAECFGGGGGGGGAAGGAANVSSGGGGGSGGYSRARLTSAQIGASKAVTIPAASAGGAAGNNAGTAGGDVSLGALCIAKGGSGGLGTVTGGSSAGGAGGVAGTGDDVFAGNGGGVGFGSIALDSNTASGQGAPGSFGGAPLAVIDNGNVGVTGNAGQNYGAGGGGGQSSGTANASGGGAGAKGYVRILEFNSV